MAPPSSSQKQKQAGTVPGDKKPEEVSERTGIKLTSCTNGESDGVTTLMGKGIRNPITGKVTIPNNPAFKDFVLVDLWTRREISGSVEELTKDPYLFKPVPLVYRTWIYHYEYLHNKVDGVSDENAMLKRALQRQCIDAPTSAGLWSPLMCLIPICVAVSLMDNMFLLVVGLGMNIAGQSLSNSMNTAPYYRYLRLATILPRLGFYVAMLVVFLTSSAQGGLAFLAFFVAMVAAGIDVIRGDIEAVRCYGLHCGYEVMKVLPSRVFICRRVGACYYEEIFGSRGLVDECVSGYFPWERHHHLIADIQGILVELRPMQPKDWESVYEQNVVSTEPMHFLSLDMFNEDLPNQKVVQEEMEIFQRARAALKAAKK